jgi:hypothetical protein
VLSWTGQLTPAAVAGHIYFIYCFDLSNAWKILSQKVQASASPFSSKIWCLNISWTRGKFFTKETQGLQTAWLAHLSWVSGTLRRPGKPSPLSRSSLQGARNCCPWQQQRVVGPSPPPSLTAVYTATAELARQLVWELFPPFLLGTCSPHGPDLARLVGTGWSSSSLGTPSF